MSLEKKNIENLVQQMLKMQEQNKNKNLNSEELKEIALSIGIQEFEWDEMIKTADANVNLAESHFAHENYKDAYETAVQVVAFNPNIINAQIIASKSALKLYENTSDEDYLTKAEMFANEALKRKSNDVRAIQIISSIRKLETKQKSKTKKYLLIGGAALVFVGIIILIIFSVKNAPPKENSELKFQLIEAQENAKSAWAQVENVINRRDQLIPQLFAALNTSNSGILQLQDEINKLQLEMKNANDNDKILLQAQIQEKYIELTKLVSTLNNSDEIKTLMVQIEGAYNRISVESKRYNDIVKEYNILVKKHSSEFPEFEEMNYFTGK